MLLSAQPSVLYDIAGVPGAVTKLLHLWSIPDFNSLNKVMRDAADARYYVAAQALTVSETQNLYTTLNWDSPIGLPPPNPNDPKKFYILETLHVHNNVRARYDFAKYMGEAVYTMYTNYGWNIQFAGNAATGVIDHYVNIWEIADRENFLGALMKYRSDKHFTNAVIRVSTSMWAPHQLLVSSPTASPPADAT